METAQLADTLSPQPSTTAISCTELSKVYTDGIMGRSRFCALKKVTFSVQAGEIFGLLGPNGAGKTTFIKVLLGIIKKTSGHATLMNHPAGSRAGRQMTGYLPEHLRIPPHLNAYTALECYGNLSNVPNSVIRRKRDDLLELVGLSGRAKDRCKKYSKGMLQRLGLAQALLHDPPLLILDEPTDGLDPQARAEMRQIIRKLSQRGVTIFLNSHLLQEVEMICQRVAILNRGELKYCGSVSEIGQFVKDQIGKERAEIHLTIDVIGAPSQIQKALAGFDYQINPNGDPPRFVLNLQVDHQDDVDRLVDELRSQGISLCGLSRKQTSLEDAFLHLVARPDSQSMIDQQLSKLNN